MVPCPQGLINGQKSNTNLSAILVQMQEESTKARAAKEGMLMPVKGKQTSGRGKSEAVVRKVL